jgi:hypothetical protein
MKSAWGPGFVFGVVLGVANAADPPVQAAPAKAVTPPKPPAVAAAVPERKSLDLRVGDIRKYMMPRDYEAALGQPDADKNTIVVEGQRELVPMQMIEDVPPGLMSLWYAAKNPLNSWRLLAPMVNAPEIKPSPIPPPVFRWGP